MSKKLLDNLQEMKDNQGVNYVCFLNTGDVFTDDYNLKSSINWANYTSTFYGISHTFSRNVESSIKGEDFDTVNMELMLGLIYEASELDENGQITAKSKPLRNVVRYYTGPVTYLLDGEKTNDHGYVPGSQGVIRYNKLISESRDEGFVLQAPKSFDEFKKAILSGEEFDINLSAKFRKRDNSKAKQFVKKR